MATQGVENLEVGRKAETRIASYLLTEYLERLGVEVIFGLCGHTVIALLDALGKSRIRFITTRHEQVAAHAADGYARATGKVGSGSKPPGSRSDECDDRGRDRGLDSVPMVVLAGDVPSCYYGRHPHQEINLHADADQSQIYRPFCKRVYRVDRVEDLPRIMERAFHLAQTGRPGPVLVDIPMDMLSADLPVDAFNKVPPEIARPTIDDATAERIVDALADAKNPVIYAGGGVQSARATAELEALAEALEVPVAHSLMGKGSMREDHPLLLGMTGFWGTPVANEKCRTADLILAVGTRLAEASSSSWFPGIYVRDPAHAADSYRCRSGRDRPQLPDGTGRRGGRQTGAGRAGQSRERPPASRPRTAARGDRPRPQEFCRQLGRRMGVRQFPHAPGAHLERVQKGFSRRRFRGHRRRLE